MDIATVPCQTPLHEAARAGSRDTVEWLIREGADISTIDNGPTALHEAALEMRKS